MAVSKLPAALPQYEDGYYQLQPHILERIEIWRAPNGGYQRKLSQKRIDAIAESLKDPNCVPYPAITIANIKGKLQCVDGQHRMLGHLQAGKAVWAHVKSLTQNEAIDTFVRDNGKAQALRRAEIIAGSRYPLALTVRRVANAYKAHQSQVTNLITALIGKTALPLDADTELDERQNRAVDIIMDIWTKDSRYRKQLMADITLPAARKEFINSVERSFSSPITFWLLGRIGRENIGNLMDLRREIILVRDADWKAQNLSSLRTLAKNSSVQSRTQLWETVQRRILLPAYKGQ